MREKVNVMVVKKRDGREVEFDENRIKVAVKKAFIEVDGDDSKSHDIVEKICNYIKSANKNLSVEQIQDIVESKLMTSNRKDVAKAYIIYRNNRSRNRNLNSSFIKKIQERLEATNVENANANVDENSFSGREKEASSDLQKFMAIELGGLSDDIAKAHKEMLCYQHDLDKALIGMHNCLNINLNELFTNGFRTRNGDVRPPSSLSTACQLVAVAFQCQSQVQFGGVGSIHLDYDLAPFVKKSFIKHYITAIIKDSDDFINKDLINMKEEEFDEFINLEKHKYLELENISIDDIYIDNKSKLNKKYYNNAMYDLMIEGRQSMQGLYHNLNTLESRQGSQVPFSSCNTARDTSSEGRLVSQWVFEASLNGIGKHHLTSIFPISIFQYKKGTNANKEDKNYDLKRLALKSMSKRIYPNWCNGGWSQANEDENNPDTFMSTMGKCKLAHVKPIEPCSRVCII